VVIRGEILPKQLKNVTNGCRQCLLYVTDLERDGAPVPALCGASWRVVFDGTPINKGR